MILTDANLDHWVMFYDEGWRFGKVKELKNTRARLEHPKGTKEWVDFKNIEGLGDNFDPFSGKLIRTRLQALSDSVAENSPQRTGDGDVRPVQSVRRKGRIQRRTVGVCLSGSEDSGSSSNSGRPDTALSTVSPTSGTPMSGTHEVSLPTGKSVPLVIPKRKTKLNAVARKSNGN